MAASDKSVALSFMTDLSSDSAASDGWQELTKSDYAKVIFSDLLCNPDSGTVECKFQITDNVHEDPNDFVGLFRIGYEDLSQCLASKMLSQTNCEDDGKLQRCIFSVNELPRFDDGFYQFLYVTRDQEVCGASMPFQIKMSQLKEDSSESSASEKMDAGFLLVGNERKKTQAQSKPQESASAQQSTLSKQKKEEITAWVSQNPDYYSLVKQIKEYTIIIDTLTQQNKEYMLTMDALQQGKDLAMQEVSHLYEIIGKQNGELIQLQSMLAAYEEKMRINQTLQDENNAALREMRLSLADSEEKLKKFELLQNEKDRDINRMKEEKNELQMRLQASILIRDQQQSEIDDLIKQLQEIEKKQKVQECHQVMAQKERPSLDNLIQKAQDIVGDVNATIENLNFSDKDEVEKLFQLKIQLLITSGKITRATDYANICDQNGLHKTHSIVKKDVTENSCDGSTSCPPENRVSLLTNDPVLEISDISPSSSNESSMLADSSKSEPTKADISASSSAESLVADSGENASLNETRPKEVVQSIPLKRVFESEVLEHKIAELPRLDVINEDTMTTLQTDRSLNLEDITVINRLTEKIMKRGVSLYEALELVDDFSSETGSDLSEISESSSSIKKDLLCVGRVMNALLLSLSNQSSLEPLIIVENETDKNLMCKDEWPVLLQKCALHYHIEILLEHIEKQKEEMKKVSERICEVFTQCMLLKDDVCHSKADNEKLQAIVVKKDLLISTLQADVKFKNNILRLYCNEKKKSETRAKLMEGMAEDYKERLLEASNIYRKQYTEIIKLQKKINKYKSVVDKIKASKGESYLSSSVNSSTTSSFEVIETDSVQKVSDSDTGEHMFEKASLVSFENKQDIKACASLTEPSSNHLSNKESLPAIHELKIENSTEMVSLDRQNAGTSDDSKSQKSVSILSDFVSYEDFQFVIKDHFANMKQPAASGNTDECSISCYVCKEILPLVPENTMPLTDHLEMEHSIRMCPVCGQLFEDAIPQKYYHIHVNQHFESD